MDKRVIELLGRYGLSFEEIKKNSGSGLCEVTVDEVEELFNKIKMKREQLSVLFQEPFKIESKVAGLRFEYYSILKENQVLAINLSGVLSQNRALKKKKFGTNEEISEQDRRLIDKYMFGNRERFE